ncbi:MAG: hypothetical protein QW478_00750 [Candidatus Micrarchaeaceae archaeon]
MEKPLLRGFVGLTTNIKEQRLIKLPEESSEIKISKSKNWEKIKQRNIEREKNLDKVDITSVAFNLFTTEEIDTYAVTTVNSKAQYGRNTVRDPLMGPHAQNDPCETCGKTLKTCNGHYGKIIIPHLMHPLCVNVIKLVLSCVCNSCGGLLTTEEEIKIHGIDRMRGINRLKAIKNISTSSCKRFVNKPGIEPCEPQPIYKSVKAKTLKSEFKYEYMLPYTYEGSDEEFFRKPYHEKENENDKERGIYQILASISEQDARLLGFNYGSHPKNMIINRLMVIPYCARPDSTHLDKFIPDDLTVMYNDIVSCTLEYFNAKNPQEKDELIRSLNFKISHMMKNTDGAYKQNNTRIYSDFLKRIQGKDAIIRAHIMGKRVNFSARSVLTPGSNLRVDEVGVPEYMVKNLTRPVKVNQLNIKELQSKYDNDKIVEIIPSSGQYSNMRNLVSKKWRTENKNYKLKIGDVVHKVLEDGDIVLVNRHPTLHKQNILALKAKILPIRSIQFGLPITLPMAADYDGDEVNLHVPQTEEAYIEAEQLLGLHVNLMNEETNRPMVALVFDSLTGSLFLTEPEEKVEELQEKINKLKNNLISIKDEKQKEEISKQIEKLELEMEKYKDKVMLDPVVFNQCLSRVADTEQFPTLKERVQRYGVKWGSGRSLYSAAFPSDFDYNKFGVIVKEGVLVKGKLNKSIIGTKDGGFITEMYKQLGGSAVVNFLTDAQFIINEYMSMRGFSIGLDDCIPDDPNFKRELDEKIETAIVKSMSLVSKTNDKFLEELQEKKIMDKLTAFRSEMINITQKYMRPESSLLFMVNAGKGEMVNITQMGASLGQITISNKRIPANLDGNRSLPVFEPNDPNPRARGFIINSYGSGMTPTEFFFVAQGGREGVSNRAVHTASTGYLEHQIIKACEDIYVATDGSVRSGDSAIIQFVYGDDGFNAGELTNVKIRNEDIPFFRDIQQLANKTNRKFGATV